MLSTARCRALLGPGCRLTEAQLEQLRQDLYALAEVALVTLPQHRPGSAIGNQRSQRSPYTDGAEASSEKMTPQYEAYERAAILEFDAGMDRSAAEDKANLLPVKPRSNSTKL